MSYETFVKLCEEWNVKTADVSRATGVDTSTFSAWKKGLYEPKSDKRQRIADYFGVSLEYLDTGDESLRNIEKEVQADPDPNMKTLFELAKKAKPEDLAKMVRMMEAFVDGQ